MTKPLAAFAVALALIFQLTGCTGGGGGAQGSSGSTGGTTAVPTVTLTMTDPTSGATKSSVSSGDGAIVTATVKTAAGQAVEGALVTFSLADATLASLTPQAGTALTDSGGVARLRVDAASLSAAGATTINASATITASGSDTTATGKLNFAVGAANVVLSNLSANLPAGSTSLSAYATTNVTVSVGGVSSTTPVSVSFSSTCTSSGKATLTATATSINGVATGTYVDKGCNGTDTITASISGTSTTSSISLPVTAPSAAAIQFVSATPSTIVLKGTGSATLTENSLVKFKLVDNNNLPIPNANVTFDLSTRAGGILLDSSSIALTKQTDTNGEVTVSVSAGTVPTPVWVLASHTSGSNVFRTQSIKIQISTGRPVQDRFSLSVETFNIEGWLIDGVTTTASIIASDRVGNPVPDGTAINFISSGGQIGTTSLGTCSTTNGACSTTFTSSQPRPASGRVTIVAYAVGEESFRDDNGDNARDTSEPFTDLGDLFVDADYDGVKDLGEQQINFATTALTACTSTIPSATLPNMVAGTCDGQWGAAHVREKNVIVLSGSRLTVSAASAGSLSTTPGLNPGAGCPAGPTLASVSASFLASDENGNPLPKGTTLTVSNLPSSGWSAAISPSSVGNSASPTNHTVTFTPSLVGDPAACPNAFNASIKAVTPSGATSVASQLITITP